MTETKEGCVRQPDQTAPLVEKQAKLPPVLSLKTKITLGFIAISTALLSIACSGQPSQARESTRPSTAITATHPSDPTVIRLNELNKALSEKPENITTIGPQISLLATDYYCTQLQCSSDELNRLKNSFEFLPNEDFQKQIIGTNWCTTSDQDLQPHQGGFVGGFYYFRNRKIYLNSDGIIKGADGTPRKDPGLILFDYSLHEIGHARPPVLQNSGDNKLVPYLENEQDPPLTIVHGILRYVYTPDRNLDGKPCYIVYRQYIEEAVIDDNNERLLKRLGLPKTTSASVEATRNYQVIINQYFRGDPSILFSFHQRSEESNFVGNLGLALGYPQNEAANAGDRFLAIWFVPNR